MPKKTMIHVRPRIGDVVRWHDGSGPAMTVVHIGPHGSLRCTWFKGKKLHARVVAPNDILVEEIGLDRLGALQMSRKEETEP
jgi:uncharacterized protein YodC (DUF2158 family)